MSNLQSQYDYLLDENGPAAIIIKQWLKPVGDEIIFPPTYANPKGDGPAVYNIDRFGETVSLGKKWERMKKTEGFMDVDRVEHGKERSVCVIDSIPSQANRIEPAFATIANGELVPSIRVQAKVDGEEQFVNLLDVGHRAADALVRFSPLAAELKAAMKARGRGDSAPMARLAPTSLVFGVWDSHETYVKVPRLINSIIRAHDVHEFRRSAQYFPALKYEQAGVDKVEGSNRASTEGMAEVPSTFTLGGIQARGGICRDASLNLCTLRDITTNSPDESVKLRRYILGLSLVAVTYFDGKTLNLRQGCQLVGILDKPMERKLMHADGSEKDFVITKDDAVAYAIATAKAFGVSTTPRSVLFNAKEAKAALKKKD